MLSVFSNFHISSELRPDFRLFFPDIFDLREREFVLYLCTLPNWGSLASANAGCGNSSQKLALCCSPLP